MFSTLEIVAVAIGIGALALFMNALFKGGSILGALMDRRARGDDQP